MFVSLKTQLVHEVERTVLENLTRTRDHYIMVTATSKDWRSFGYQVWDEHVNVQDNIYGCVSRRIVD